jgi:limonene 1,2-monooxygenase
MAHNWADFAETKRSYELIARYVMPHFQETNVNRGLSLVWARKNREGFIGEAMMAVGSRVAKHIEQHGTEDISPEILEAMGMKKTDAAE